MLTLEVFLVTASFLGGQQDPPKDGFRDPAPPEVNELESLAPPAPQSTEGLTFHRAPKERAPGAVSEDSPMLLGPRRDGHSRETGLALDWPEGGPPLVWELVAGRGFAAPVVAEARVVFTHRQGGEVHVDCLEPETGRRFWRYSTPCAYKDRYISNDGPRSTPVIADGDVYVHGVEGELVCLELATGRVRWRRNTCKEFDIPLDFFGVVASPLVSGDLLYQNLGTPGPCVAAFDRKTGALRWGAGPKWGPSCASPVLGRVGGRERLFVLAGGDSRPPTGGLVVLDPVSGEVQYEHPFRSRTYESVLGSSPVLCGEERVFLSASYNTGSAGIEWAAEGGFREAWADRHIGLQFSTAIHRDGVLYLIDGVADRTGALVALDPADGKVLSRTELVWEDTISRDGKSKEMSFTVGEGSLLAVQDKLLCLGDNGHLLVLDADREGAEVMDRAWLFGANESWTPPVVVNGLLYVRQTGPERFGDAPARLLCYDLRAEPR